MKLTAVRDTLNGVEQIGCRASGIYKGYHIERTAWAPLETAEHLILGGELRKLAEGRYNRECRTIDQLIQSK